MIPNSATFVKQKVCLARLSYEIKGFTLIEILVVIVIIGVILSFATLAIGDGGRAKQLEQETQRLAWLLTQARYEAIMQAEEFGLLVDVDEYRFYKLQGQDWQVLQEDIFRPHSLPSGIQSELRIDGNSIILNKKCQQSSCAPQLLLLSSGEFTPFEIMLTMNTDNNLSYRLIGTATGAISIHHDD